MRDAGGPRILGTLTARLALAALLATGVIVGCTRPLGPVCYDFLVWQPAAVWSGEGSEPRSPRVDTNTLHIPFGQRLDFFLDLEPNSVLTIGELSARGSARGSLAVELQAVGGPTQAIVQLTVAEPREFPPTALPEAVRGIVRMSFSAAGERDGDKGGIDLSGPVLRSPSPRVSEPRPSSRADGEATTGVRPNVIVYVIDTLRRDALGTYGSDRAVSPSLDAFAADAWVFDAAVAQSPWTRPSIASIFTGLEPDLHQANLRTEALAPDFVTLAELLSAAGYRTSAVITNGNVGEEFGFAQGFDDFSAPLGLGLPSAELNERLLPMLEDVAKDQPFLLYAHSIGPHAPYEPPEPFRGRFVASGVDAELGGLKILKEFRGHRREIDDATHRDIVSLYDGEVAFHDSLFGDFIRRLKDLDLYDSSLIIVLSDHGEEFWEHDDWGHGHTLYAELLDIPLVVKEPFDDSRGRIGQLVQHVDLFPTILDYCGIEVPNRAGGRSLRKLLADPSFADERRAYGHLDLDMRKARSLTFGEWKLILPGSFHLGSEPMLFNRRQDPRETRNLARERPVIAGYLGMLLRARALAHGAQGNGVDVRIGDERAAELRALGYLD